MDRSYLFAPGHNAKLLGRVFEAGADAVMLDLEDAVRPTPRTRPGRWSPRPFPTTPPGSGSTPPEPSGARPTWPPSARGRSGSRIPKCESAEDVRWVASAPRQADHLRRRAPARYSPPPRSPPRQCGTWPWARSTSRTTSTPAAATSDPVRPLPPGGRVPGGRPGAADRQRLPEARRRGRAARAGNRSPARSGSSASRPSILGSCPSSTVFTPLRAGARLGPGRGRLRGRRRQRSSCPAEVRRPAGGATRPPSAGVGGRTHLTGGGMSERPYEFVSTPEGRCCGSLPAGSRCWGRRCSTGGPRSRPRSGGRSGWSGCCRTGCRPSTGRSAGSRPVPAPARRAGQEPVPGQPARPQRGPVLPAAVGAPGGHAADRLHPTVGKAIGATATSTVPPGRVPVGGPPGPGRGVVPQLRPRRRRRRPDRGHRRRGHPRHRRLGRRRHRDRHRQAGRLHRRRRHPPPR